MKSGLLTVCVFAFSAAIHGQTQALRTVDFATEVHPLLESRCAGCHSGGTPQASFRIDSRDALLKGGKSGPAMVPGKSSESLLILKVTGQKGLPMPPSGPRLSADNIAVLRNWIDQGARWDAVAPRADEPARLEPRNPTIPPGDATNPIDRFIAAYLESKQVDPPGTISDRMFARRVYFDLHGLPPSPAELDAFLADTKPDKRSTLATHLLADRDRYAEHWISFWNDLLRNDEGVIYHGDRKTITTWLLNALRANMPYDRMVQALLNPVSRDDPEGFLIGVNWRGVVSASQSPPMQASQNSAQVFLGMNLKCAACHDSFVNRWKLRDTFGLASMFSKEQLEMVRCDVPTGKMAEARFPIGDLAAGSAALPKSRRAEAAEWFTRRENGRFARTVVNRYWRLLFGRAIVEPVDDMDSEPWSRDLLDWLAWDFAEHDFDLQHLLLQIVTSRAYQMPVAPPGGKDYVFRGPLPRRLTAEQYQDALSCVSGEWRVMTPRTSGLAWYTREWRLKSDPLSRALGRPIRDQVYTERNTQPSTLQALELTNGPLLSDRLERAARAMLGQLPAAPANLFDSNLMRSGTATVDIDISGAKELWLVTEDVDSYNPAKVLAGWTNVKLTGPGGTAPIQELATAAKSTREFHTKTGTASGLAVPVPSTLHWQIGGRGFTRFQATVAIDEDSVKSDISPAIRFFVFTSKPDPERLVRIEGSPPVPRPEIPAAANDLVDRVYLHLLSRKPEAEEKAIGAPHAVRQPADRFPQAAWKIFSGP